MERALANRSNPPDPASSWTWSAAPAWDHGDWAAEFDDRPQARRPSPTNLAPHFLVVVLMMVAAAGGMLLASERRAAARSGPDHATPAMTRPSDEHDPETAFEEAESDDDRPSTGSAQAVAPAPVGVPEVVAWETESTYTLQELSQAWGIPGATLSALNPALDQLKPIPEATVVTVYSRERGDDVSVGHPNAGRLVHGVPLPESDAWELARGRTRAFGTADTIENLTTALTTYARAFPSAQPVEIGDISALRGGKVSSHDSHQTGRDVDIMLVRDESGEGFSPERNWFLVKTLIDQGSVQTIFLNASQQPWLEQAAVLDIGAERADRYLDRVRHEPGHDHHMHVRFLCPDGDRSRCINYTQ